MKTTINPFKWASYTKLLVGTDTEIRNHFGSITLGNIETVAPVALELLTKKAIEKNLSTEEFAYVLYSMNNDNAAYMAIYALEAMHGRLPLVEKEAIADGIASIYYKLIKGLEVPEYEIANVYKPTYERLNLAIPA